MHILGVNSSKVDDGRKDVVVLEGAFFTRAIAGLINFMFPGSTINVFRDGKFKKAVYDPPVQVSGIMDCLNPLCITNNDPEAEARFWVASDPEKRRVQCCYCLREFRREEMLGQIK